MRAVAAAVACVLAGLGAGGIWTWAQPDRYRADARVLVRPAGSRIVPAVEALAESSIVEANVALTLQLSSRPDVSAKTGDGGVLTVSVEAGRRERARQIDAEAVVVLIQKIEQRFGETPGVTATVLDPAHVEEQTSPTPGRNLLVGGLAGVVLGLGVAFASRRRPPLASTGADPSVERRLHARVDQVAKRERALAKRAGELAARERRLEQREAGAAAAAAKQERELEQRRDDLHRLEAERGAPPPVAPAVPSDDPAAASAGSLQAGGWTLGELETLVRERVAAGADRAQQDEWSTYLFFLREHAGPDGALPATFDRLVYEVFAPLPSRMAE